MNSNQIYNVKNLKVFYGQTPALAVDNLTVREGEVLGLVGPNGSGKSTLLKTLAFLQPHQEGQLFSKINRLSALEVAFLPQDPLLLKRNVYENIAYGLKIRNIKENLSRVVYEALDRVGIPKSYASRWWNSLSGGEAQRIALAARLVLKPKVLLLDEPTANVDENSANMISSVIFSIKKNWNTSLIISSHDHGWLEKVADRVIMLVKGNIIGHQYVNLIDSEDLPAQLSNNQGALTAVIDPDDIALLPLSELAQKKTVEGDFCYVHGKLMNICYEEQKESFLLLLDCGFPLRVRINLRRGQKIENDIPFPGTSVQVFWKISSMRWIS